MEKKPRDPALPVWDGTENNYAIVGASHTALRTITIPQQNNSFFRKEVTAREVSGLGGIIKVRNQNYHVYNDLDVFLIDNTKKKLPSDFLASDKFDETFIHWNGRKERLNGCITQVWSGDFDVENDVLKVGDMVYFLGRHNKSFGEVAQFFCQFADMTPHYLIKCRLNVKKGDDGGILFKRDPVKNEYIVVGICSYFVKIPVKEKSEEPKVYSYFAPLTDLEKSVYLIFDDKENKMPISDDNVEQASDNAVAQQDQHNHHHQQQ